jgi:hypothetical protein
MTDDTIPYIPRNPGDLITAQDWDGMQVEIKKDMASRISASEEKIKQSGVNHATDADEFAGKSAGQWTADLDDRYAPKIHDHEGLTSYRRYMKRFTNDPGFDRLLLPHKLGRYPLVDAYELMPVVGTVNDQTQSFAGCKLFFYYGNEDADTYGLWAVAYRDRVPLGLRFGPLLAELKVSYTDHTSIEDLLNDFWDALARDPNDRIPHCHSPWTDESCERHRTVANLKSSGQWDDLYLAIRPRKLAIGSVVGGAGPGGMASTGIVQVTHANYDTLLVEVAEFPVDEGQGPRPLDLMFLLRS